MRKHKGHGSCLPSRCRSLGSVCGTSIDTDDLEFTGARSNLAYIDKVFAFKEDTSCPIMTCLNTGGMASNNFIAEIETKELPNRCDCDDCGCGNSCGCGNGCGCRCSCQCTSGSPINKNSIFNIEKSYVAVEYFNTRPPGRPPAMSVCIDGCEVENIKYSNGQFAVNTAEINSEIQKERCQDAGLPTKAFFVVNCAGPWDFRAKYILEGTVNTDGRVYCFRAEIQNAPGRPNTALPNNALSSFAIPGLSIPCTINGIAPTIFFQFGANIDLIRPKLSVSPTPPRPKHCDKHEHDDCERHHHDDLCECICECICRCNNSDTDFAIALTANLAIEPTIHVETVRKTLCCLTACEALQPCDGSELAAEMEDDEDDVDPFGPDCTCGNSDVSPEISNGCGCNHRHNNSWGNNSCGCNRDSNRGKNCNHLNGCSGCTW